MEEYTIDSIMESLQHWKKLYDEQQKDLNKYETELDRCCDVLSDWDLSMSRNGRLNVADHLALMKDILIQKGLWND